MIVITPIEQRPKLATQYLSNIVTAKTTHPELLETLKLLQL